MLIDATEAVLIEERTLTALLNATNYDKIKVTIGKNVQLEAAGIKVTHPLSPVENFPAIHVLPDRKPFVFNQEITDSLAIAKSFVSDQLNDQTFRYVHMKPTYIAATDRFKLYYESFKKLPTLVFGVGDIDLVCKMTDPEIYDDDKFYAAVSGSVTYFFVKPESVTPNFDGLYTRFNEAATMKLKINKADLVEFCNLANAVSDSKLSTCVICKDGFGLNDAEKTIMKAASFPDIYFKFNARNILPAIKPLPIEVFECEVIHEAIIIKEDKLLIGLMPTV